MKWFRNMKVSVKLLSSFIIVAMLSGVVGVIGTININQMDKDYEFMYDNYGTPLESIGVLGIYFHKNRTELRNVLLSNDPAEQEEIRQTTKGYSERIAKELAIFTASAHSDEMKRLLAELEKYIDEYDVVFNRIIDHVIKGEREQANVLVKDAQALTLKTDETIQAIFTMKNEDGKIVSDGISQAAGSTVIMMVSIIIAAIVLAIVLGVIIARSISRPINSLVVQADRIAAGDLDVSIKADTNDEIGQLAAAFKKMTDNLNEVMSSIAAASDQVAAGAKQMSESSIILSQGATEQASSVEELTVSLEELSTKINENANGANQAAEMADATKNNAINGNDHMKKMLVSMDEINESSSNISKIIKVIDEIAFQTNILALNAAVEAARAGQHGKGFAVVAEEVRNLAARSANAAKETTEMIEGSINKVAEGMKIADLTAEALNGIVKGVTHIADLARQAADNSAEQSIGVTQINQGLLQVSQVIQTNSATSEESAAASEELTGQAEMLKEQVRRFNLRRGYNQNTRFMNGRSASWQSSSSVNSVDEQFAEAAAGLDSFVISDKEFGKY